MVVEPLESIYQDFKENKARINMEWACGFISDEQAHKELIDNALESIERLKMPEDQSWELAEYGYMAKGVN